MLDFLRIVLIGVGATAIFDLYLMLLARLGLPGANWTMGGRWFAHMPRGTFVHASIADAASIPGETAVGWTMHYLIGILYVGVVVIVAGLGWLDAPTLLPALIVGWVTVLAGWLVMAPAMGAGFAASRRPNKWTVRAVNLSAHTVFGLGMWLVALVFAG
ncbi:DUF2938 family protein [Acuticoccus sp. I52.16.1]|uniref:DUF2938 family protein n=1 Tax=Acuticoccus sp. I52.16.1 TaxID=2928472 RepID=UPI001FD26F65|nr:DUF2938 family protein [Acuticoccus sp. I52.16.1]UOM35159.1 DUF2938 domain-containing protein [Acuticoccus sp. I52.16.1]